MKLIASRSGQRQYHEQSSLYSNHGFFIFNNRFYCIDSLDDRTLGSFGRSRCKNARMKKEKSAGKFNLQAQGSFWLCKWARRRRLSVMMPAADDDNMTVNERSRQSDGAWWIRPRHQKGATIVSRMKKLARYVGEKKIHKKLHERKTLSCARVVVPRLFKTWRTICYVMFFFSYFFLSLALVALLIIYRVLLTNIFR